MKSADSNLAFENAKCTRYCGHICCNLLYQLADFKMRDVKAIPTDVMKTTTKMSFYEPQGLAVLGKPIDELSVKAHVKVSNNPAGATSTTHISCL